MRSVQMFVHWGQMTELVIIAIGGLREELKILADDTERDLSLCPQKHGLRSGRQVGMNDNVGVDE